MAKAAGQLLIEELIRNGHAWIEGQEYIGRASDGVEVGLGMLGDEKAMYAYLGEHPTPDTW